LAMPRACVARRFAFARRAMTSLLSVTSLVSHQSRAFSPLAAMRRTSGTITSAASPIAIISGAPLPDQWVAACVKDGDNDDAERLGAVVDAVGKALGDNSTDFVVNNGTTQWLLSDQRDTT